MAKKQLITAKQLMQISIFTNKEKLRQARGRGQITMLGKRWYDLSKINPIFLKQSA